VEDDESSGRPRFHRTDENVEKVRKPVSTFIQAYYVQILKRLRETMRRKRSEL
jgi:hypothetical protein